MVRRSGRTRRLPRPRRCGCLAIGLLLGAATTVFAADPPPPSKPPAGKQPAKNPREPVPPSTSRTPAAALHHALALLEAEAKQTRETGQLSRAMPDFCETFTDQMPAAGLARRLARPVDRDPLIDAYVRWQLAGCTDVLPAMSDREFARFLAQLPPLVENPRADASLMHRLNAIVRAGSLDEALQAQVGADLDELAARTSRAAALNQAALGFRDWIRDHLPETGPRRLELELERCAAVIAAGWSVDEHKQALDATIAAAAHDPHIDAAARRRLGMRLERLEGPGRMYVGSARLVEGTLSVEYRAAAVYDFDVRRWQRMLAPDRGSS